MTDGQASSRSSWGAERCAEMDTWTTGTADLVPGLWSLRCPVIHAFNCFSCRRSGRTCTHTALKHTAHIYCAPQSIQMSRYLTSTTLCPSTNQILCYFTGTMFVFHGTINVLFHGSNCAHMRTIYVLRHRIVLLCQDSMW